MVKLDHICLIVEDMDAAIDHYCKLLEVDRKDIYYEPDYRETGADLMKVAFIPAGEGKVELIQPLKPDGAMAKVFAKRGEGLHHECFTVEPKKFHQFFKGLKQKGFKVLDEEPREDVGHPGIPYTWIHPRGGTHGLLVEIMPHLHWLEEDKKGKGKKK